MLPHVCGNWFLPNDRRWAPQPPTAIGYALAFTLLFQAHVFSVCLKFAFTFCVSPSIDINAFRRESKENRILDSIISTANKREWVHLFISEETILIREVVFLITIHWIFRLVLIFCCMRRAIIFINLLHYSIAGLWKPAVSWAPNQLWADLWHGASLWTPESTCRHACPTPWTPTPEQAHEEPMILGFDSSVNAE